MEFLLTNRPRYYFRQISDIPRASRNEKAICEYIAAFAQRQGLEYKSDEAYNIIVNKPATKGYEDVPAIILQAHTDMVCEKNKGVEHDFDRDPLDLYVDEEGFLHARGTTLGADDGYGVAYMLAILEDTTLKHPALQCAFTSMEEIGLLGAQKLKKEDFYGKRYINLDAGGEDQTAVSSSGGTRTKIERKLAFEENDAPSYTLRIRGLQGGHSAGMIHLERGNAIQIAARVLYALSDKCNDLKLCDFNGGDKINAIPRECDVTSSTHADLSDIRTCAQAPIDQIGKELQYSDAGFHAFLEETAKCDKSLSIEDSRQIINFLYVLPNGLQHRSMAIEGLSVASLNLGAIAFENDSLRINHLIRSAAASHGDQMIAQLAILSENFGFHFEVISRYYGWDYEKDSPFRNILKEVLKEKGIEMKEHASHGGLECGVFKGMIPELDLISYGPISEGAHSPQEKMDLSSFDRCYDTLVKILENAK